MADEQTTTETTPTVVGFDTTDYHAFRKMLNDPDAKDAAEKAWAASAAPAEATKEVAEPETEVEEAATEETVSEAEEEDTEEDEGEDTEEEPAAKPKRKSGYVRKIEKLERLVAELQAKQAPATEQKPAQETQKGPPKLSEFNYDEDKHAAALAEYFRSEVARENLQAEQNREHQDAVNAYAESETKAREVYADFDQAMENVSDLKFGPVAVFALVNSDHQAELAYALAKEPKLAKQIADLSNSQNPADHLKASRLMGLVEGRLESSQTARTEAKKTPIVSKAPPPGKPISAKSGAATRTASDVLDDFSSTGDMDKAHKLSAEYEKLTGRKLLQ